MLRQQQPPKPQTGTFSSNSNQEITTAPTSTFSQQQWKEKIQEISSLERVIEGLNHKITEMR